MTPEVLREGGRGREGSCVPSGEDAQQLQHNRNQLFASPEPVIKKLEGSAQSLSGHDSVCIVEIIQVEAQRWI